MIMNQGPHNFLDRTLSQAQSRSKFVDMVISRRMLHYIATGESSNSKRSQEQIGDKQAYRKSQRQL